jgi:hypothetical protein
MKLHKKIACLLSLLSIAGTVEKAWASQAEELRSVSEFFDLIIKSLEKTRIDQKKSIEELNILEKNIALKEEEIKDIEKVIEKEENSNTKESLIKSYNEEKGILENLKKDQAIVLNLYDVSKNNLWAYEMQATFLEKKKKELMEKLELEALNNKEEETKFNQ